MPVRRPSTTLNIIPAEAIIRSEEHRVLVVNQMLTGSATSGELVENVGDSDAAINALFGQRSIIANQLRSFKEINTITQIDAIGVADASGTAATATITMAGTSTAAGTYTIEIGSAADHSITVSIPSGSDANTAAAAIDTAIQASGNYADAPYQSAVATATVTVTAEHDGTIANNWQITVSGTVPGLTPTVVGWANGATDPVITSVLDVIGSRRYQTILWPSSWDTAVVRTLLDGRFNVTNDIQDGRALQTVVDSLADLPGLVSGYNSQNMVVIGLQEIDETLRKGSSVREFPDVVTAYVGAVRALRLTQDGNLTQYQTTTAARDQFGSSALSTLPYFNTAIPQLPVPLPDDDWTDEEATELNDDGIAIVAANPAFNRVILGEFVTTYLTDNAGNPDTSYHFLNTVDAVSEVRERFVTNLRARYAQTRLTDGDIIRGRAMTNPQEIFSYLTTVRETLVDDAILAGGPVADNDFLDTTVVEITDLAAGEVRIDMAPLLVSQLRAIIGTIQVNFGTNV